MRSCIALLLLTACATSGEITEQGLDDFLALGSPDFTDRCAWRERDHFAICSLQDAPEALYELSFAYPFDTVATSDVYAHIPTPTWLDSRTRPGLPSEDSGGDAALLELTGTCDREHTYVMTDDEDALLLAGGNTERWSDLGWEVTLEVDDPECAPRPCGYTQWGEPVGPHDDSQCTSVPVRFTRTATGESISMYGPSVGVMSGYQLVVNDAVLVDGAEQTILNWYIRKL